MPFPELATFFGYAGDAIDLTGMWKMSTTAAYDAGSAAPGLDDSSWPEEPAPGHAHHALHAAQADRPPPAHQRRRRLAREAPQGPGSTAGTWRTPATCR